MLRVLAILSLPAVLAGVLSLGASKLVGDPPPAQWIIWGGTAFSNPASFAEWLERRGFSYREWADDHPAAAARLEGREAPEADAAPDGPPAAAAAATKAKPQRATQGLASSRSASAAQASTGTRARSTPEQGHSSGGASLMLLALVVVAVALVALASLPIPMLEAIRAPNILAEHRLELAVTGASIALGMGAAQLLT